MTEIGLIAAAVLLTLVLGGCLYLIYVCIQTNDADEEERRKVQ